ncbi:unnamed protein product [Spirodela intermedia]|uniref:Uncharacterized protein n=1 Tax=Spirodela intermedia TaxID=51605 RepID=A0ABN7E9G8_SPIIN|nr:unnamed protein product [Spirodela intermedia]
MASAAASPWSSAAAVAPRAAPVGLAALRPGSSRRRQNRRQWPPAGEASMKEKAWFGDRGGGAARAVPVAEELHLSIVSGGVVLGVILGAVIAVSNFDPVKRT